MAQKVSISVIRRLPRYYRYLGDLMQNGIFRISSRELAQMMHLTASQIRQDLNCFGGFGQQGYGYNVSALHSEIATILGLNQKLKTVLIGVGNLGKTIATQLNYDTLGFDLIAAFDSDPKKIATPLLGLEVMPMEKLEEICKSEKPEVAILCLPKDSAINIAGELIALGVKGFWNFSQYDIQFDAPGVIVENVRLSDSIMTLRCQMDISMQDDEQE